ncbi:MAG: SDR family oxidoreductase [Pirellulales bacterium]|nr:SDR family oxidoreductase [Pirellulales bacterium]
MNHILLTGGTGVVGSAIVPLLLRRQATVHLIVRAGSQEELQQRSRHLTEYWTSRDGSHRPAATQFYRGDVTKPQLGLQPDEYASLQEKTTHVIHSAGNVRLNLPIEAARACAVDSVREILRFSEPGLAAGRIQKLEIVSTIGVAGAVSGAVPERRLTERRQFRNTYEAAKAEAEELCWNAIDVGAPLTIHRPSMVVGDSLDGAAMRTQVFSYIVEFLSGRRTWGILPNLRHARLDIIPVDYVARAIVESCFRPQWAGRILHLCSGPEYELPLQELATEVRNAYTVGGFRLPPCRVIPLALCKAFAKVAVAAAPKMQRRRLQSLKYLLAYLDSPQSFTVAETRRLLMERSLRIPAPVTYLPRLLDLQVGGTAMS